MTTYIQPKGTNDVIPLTELPCDIENNIKNICDTVREYLGDDFANYIDNIFAELLDDTEYWRNLAEEKEI